MVRTYEKSIKPQTIIAELHAILLIFNILKLINASNNDEMQLKIR